MPPKRKKQGGGNAQSKTSTKTVSISSSQAVSTAEGKKTKSPQSKPQRKKYQQASSKSSKNAKASKLLTRFYGLLKWMKAAQKKLASKSKKEVPKEPAAERAGVIQSIIDKPRIPGELGKRIYCSRLMKGLAPFRWFAIVTGHFPFDYQKHTDGTYEFRFQWTHFNTFLYILNGIFTMTFLLSGSITVFSITSQLKLFEHQSLPIQKEIVFYEMVLVKRHFIYLWTLTAAGCCSVIAFVNTFLKRHYLPSIYTYYFQVTRLLHLDLHEGTKTTGLVMIAFYLITTMVIYIMGFCKFAPMTLSVPLLVGDCMYGFFFKLYNSVDEIWILERPDIRWKLQLLGGITILFIYISSKAKILLFIFHCKVLRNAFAAWNGRTYIYMMKSAKYMVSEEGASRLKLIYKDHCLILDLMEGLNTSFAFVIETFYSFQMGAAFFELYFVIRTAKAGYDVEGSKSQEIGEGNYFIRPHDWAPGLIIAIQTLVFVIVTSKVASDVGEEALAGVDIVRRRVFLRRKTDEDLFFQLSMQNSFDSYRRFDIAGGQYGYINKDWIQGWINTLAGYFIILYQFQPLLDEETKHDKQKRKAIGEFLNVVEGLTPISHWYINGSEAPPIIRPQDLLEMTTVP